MTISADALFQRAARLPRIDVRKPATVVGRTTVGAMESGLFYGYVGMVEGLVRRMSDELGGRAICVATGGLASVIAPETESFTTSTSISRSRVCESCGNAIGERGVPCGAIEKTSV